MEWLNYHHLLYFHKVVKLGSISAASAELRLSQPTIGKQIHELEGSLGEKLLEKRGRGLVPTEIGRMVFDCAGAASSPSAGRSWTWSRTARPAGPCACRWGGRLGPQAGRAGAAGRRAAAGPQFPGDGARGRAADLVSRLALHQLDVVTPTSPRRPACLKAYNHLIGDCSLGFFALKPLARMLKKGFPKSLDGIPAILPTSECGIRLALDKWFEDNDIQPLIVAECDDRSLIKLLGQSGAGFFPAPKSLAKHVEQAFNAIWIGEARGVRESYYAITVERRIKHPGVLAITQHKLPAEKGRA
ncbi:MAG: LysR family transcriptional regulator [Kiritimatiellia bacterium]